MATVLGNVLRVQNVRTCERALACRCAAHTLMTNSDLYLMLAFSFFKRSTRNSRSLSHASTEPWVISARTRQVSRMTATACRRRRTTRTDALRRRARGCHCVCGDQQARTADFSEQVAWRGVIVLRRGTLEHRAVHGAGGANRRSAQSFVSARCKPINQGIARALRMFACLPHTTCFNSALAAGFSRWRRGGGKIHTRNVYSRWVRHNLTPRKLARHEGLWEALRVLWGEAAVVAAPCVPCQCVPCECVCV